MKSWHKWLIAAVLLAAPVYAWSQTVAQDGQRADPGRVSPGQSVLVGGLLRSDSTVKTLTVDASGYLKIVDSDRDRNNYRFGTLLDSQLGASGLAMADSSTPIATYDLKRIGLMFYPQHDSASTVVRIAVQIRAHSSTGTDSISAFPWNRWAGWVGITATNVRSDSVGHFTTVGTAGVPATPVQATSANSANGGLIPGEFVLTFNISRNDTTGAGNGKPWSYPKGVYLPLIGSQGEWFWAPYMSVRIRVLNGVAARFKLRVDYAGTPL